MRSLLLFFSLFCMTPLIANPHSEEPREMAYYTYLLNEDSSPNAALTNLLSLLQVSYENNLESVVKATQKSWLQTGKERWEFEAKDEDKREFLLPIFRQIGLVDGTHARAAEYDYALVHGGFYSRVQKRICHLVEENRRGVRFKQIVLLTGQRYLDTNTEESILPFNTEAEMMLFVWENYAMPDEMRRLPVTLVDAPRQEKPDGSWGRPGTKETFIEWMKTSPKAGRCLCISSQPFCGYQDSVARTCLPSTFTIETIGTEADPEMDISIYLDNLARWLYQERIRREGGNGISP